MAKETMRLDRFLVLSGACKSRTDAKKCLHDHCVYVNDRPVSSAELQVHPLEDTIEVNGRTYRYVANRYFLLNKPKGVVSATKDRISETVLSLIPEADAKEYFPVGRLDKDTEGLLLITNDGELAHRITSPRHEIKKTYFVRITGVLQKAEEARLNKGISFEEFTSKPAEYKLLREDSEESECLLTITEGKFHEVKRLFHAVGHEVLYLKRISIGGLVLPEEMKPGEYREYTLEQLNEAIFTVD